MIDKNPCKHCSRMIDPTARLCPYCNGDREAPVKVAEPKVAAAPPPPAEKNLIDKIRKYDPRQLDKNRLSTRALMFAAGAVLLVLTFVIGGFFYGLGHGDKAVERVSSEAPAAPPVSSRSDVGLTLVPATDTNVSVGTNITSMPVPDADLKLPPEYQRTDATALPSEEYARVLEQSKNEVELENRGTVDPRLLQAAPPPPPPQSRPVEQIGERDEPVRASVAERRTPPQPIYQPLPRIGHRLRKSGTIKFSLLVGENGRVREVRLVQGMPGVTGKMVAAVQKWRFKPATVNGEPVEGTFDAEVTFSASDDD